MDLPALYIFTITWSHTNWPSQSINLVALSITGWLTHIQFSVEWISQQGTYSPLLHLIPTSHPNPLTMLLCPVLTGRCISNSVFNASAGIYILLCLVPTGQCISNSVLNGSASNVHILLCLVQTGHPNPLTLLLGLVLTS